MNPVTGELSLTRERVAVYYFYFLDEMLWICPYFVEPHGNSLWVYKTNTAAIAAG